MRILIISWNWPPIGRIGSMRPLGMAREWTRAGHEVHVLTGPGDRGGEYCPDLEPAARESGAIVHRAACPGLIRPGELRPAYAESPSGPAVSRPISRLRQVLGQWKGFPDLQRSWIRPASGLGRKLHGDRPFDVAWSTSPPESVHFVGHALARLGVPWVPDFRDQWSEYLLARWDPLSRWLIDRLTKYLLESAAAASANTEGVAESIARASHRDVRCVRNGWDPVGRSGAPVRERTLGYFGRVDPNFQHPERLWQPLRTLREAGHPWRVEFFLAPGGGGGAEIAVPPDLRDLVSVRRPLTHPDAQLEMQTMTALLVLAWETRGGEASVAGKLYEYVGSNRPVFVCAPRHFEARRLVEEARAGLGAWGDTEIVAALRQIETFEVSAPARRALSREAMAQELAGVLDAATVSQG